MGLVDFFFPFHSEGFKAKQPSRLNSFEPFGLTDVSIPKKPASLLSIKLFSSPPH